MLAACVILSGCSSTPESAVQEETAEETGTEAEADTAQETTEDTTEQEQASEESDAEKGTGGTPWIDSDIKENITADMETNPKDDFHVCADERSSVTVF